MQCDNEITPDVIAVGSINIEGNVVALEWYKHLKTDSGKPDAIAVSLLADIVYWYRPTHIRCETTGDLIGYRKKFHADLLQRNYEQFENQFGYSTKQVREALTRLEKIGLISRVFRTVQTNGRSIPNVMYIKLYPEKLREITGSKGISKKGNIPSPKRKHTSTPAPSHLSLKGNTYTNNTTNITTNTLSQAPIEKNNEIIASDGREIEMIKIWNTWVEATAPLDRIASSRAIKLLQVLETSFSNSLEEWMAHCKKISTSNFLMGRTKKDFKASLDWALAEEIIAKVKEGAYGTTQDAVVPSLVVPHNQDAITCPDWQRVKEALREHYGDATFKSWFSKLSLQFNCKSNVILCVPTNFVKERVDTHYLNHIKKIWDAIGSQPVSISIIVEKVIISTALQTPATQQKKEKTDAAVSQSMRVVSH